MKVFLEEQRFNQWWFRLLMLIASIITIGSIIMAYPELKPDTTAFGAITLAGTFALIIIFTLLFWVKLETKIDEYGIQYRFWPIHLKSKMISWMEIASCSVERYRPIADFGGWGFRISFRKKGVALSTQGNIGIQIVFKNGKKLLIGTQKEDEARKVLQTYLAKLESI